MRKFLIITILTLFAVSCKVNDIAFYDINQEPRIEFNKDALSLSCTFSDADYLNANILGGEAFKEFSFVAQLIGYLLESEMTFVLTTEPVASAFNPELGFDNPYTFPAQKDSVSAAFRVRCPGKNDVSSRTTTHTGQVDLVYDFGSEDHQFLEGRVENLKARVNVVLQIYPSDWNSAFWGSYSTAKYLLMMETFRAVHGNIEQSAQTKEQIIAAYNDYKAAHGALYGDDAAAGTEISFPL